MHAVWDAGRNRPSRAEERPKELGQSLLSHVASWSHSSSLPVEPVPFPLPPHLHVLFPSGGSPPVHRGYGDCFLPYLPSQHLVVPERGVNDCYKAYL